MCSPPPSRRISPTWPSRRTARSWWPGTRSSSPPSRPSCSRSASRPPDERPTAPARAAGRGGYHRGMLDQPPAGARTRPPSRAGPATGRGCRGPKAARPALQQPAREAALLGAIGRRPAETIGRPAEARGGRAARYPRLSTATAGTGLLPGALEGDGRRRARDGRRGAIHRDRSGTRPEVSGPRPGRNRGARWAGAALAIALLSGPPMVDLARAHAVLVRSAPSHRAVLGQAPERVRSE